MPTVETTSPIEVEVNVTTEAPTIDVQIDGYLKSEMFVVDIRYKFVPSSAGGFNPGTFRWEFSASANEIADAVIRGKKIVGHLFSSLMSDSLDFSELLFAGVDRPVNALRATFREVTSTGITIYYVRGDSKVATVETVPFSGGGGGISSLLVTFSESNGVLTADKTFAEVTAAIADGAYVYATDTRNIYYALSECDPRPNDGAVTFVSAGSPNGGYMLYYNEAVNAHSSSFATEAWVQNRYQSKSIIDAGGYYTTDTVEGALQEIGAELSDYATEQWVQSQGYITAAQVVTQGNTVIDDTLSVVNAAADAKAVGDILLPLNAEVNGGIGEEVAVGFYKGNIAKYGYADSSSTGTGRLVHNEYIAGPVQVSCDTGFNFVVVLYDENKTKEGVLLSDGSIVTSFSASLYSDSPVIVPKGKYCRISARKGTGNNIALTDAQYIHVNKIDPSLLETVDERLEAFEGEVGASVETLNNYVIGAVGSDYEGEVTWVIGSPGSIGYTDTSATSTGRLISGFISGKVQLSATDDVNFFVVQYDMNGNKEGAIMRDGTLNTSNTVDYGTWYSMDAVIIPKGKQGRVMARKGTENNIALTDAEYISIKNVSDSAVDKTQDSYLVSVAHPNLYQKNIALMGDSLTEQSSLWFTRITSKYFMNTRIEGHGNQRWWSNTQLPNGAVTQVDNLVASDFTPDFIVLEFGTNDIWQSPTLFGEYTDTADKTVAKTVPAMRYCIETLQSNYPDAKILVLMPNLRNNNGLEPEAQKTYRDLANAVLDDYGIFRWDMYKYAGIVKSVMATDGVHMCALEGNHFVPRKALYKYSDAFGAALLNLG